MNNDLLIGPSVGLKVTSLNWSGTDQNDSGSIKQIPDDIQYSTTISREEDIGIERDDTSQVVQSEPSEFLGHNQEQEQFKSNQFLNRQLAAIDADTSGYNG